MRELLVLNKCGANHAQEPAPTSIKVWISNYQEPPAEGEECSGDYNEIYVNNVSTLPTLQVDRYYVEVPIGGSVQLDWINCYGDEECYDSAVIDGQGTVIITGNDHVVELNNVTLEYDNYSLYIATTECPCPPDVCGRTCDDPEYDMPCDDPCEELDECGRCSDDPDYGQPCEEEPSDPCETLDACGRCSDDPDYDMPCDEEEPIEEEPEE